MGLKILVITALCVFLAISCKTNTHNTLKITKLQNCVGMVSVGDTVKISFKIKNVGSDSISLHIIPECDCTTVFPETLFLPSSGKSIVNACYLPDQAEDFRKYIYVQTSACDEFHTVEISGTSVDN